MKKYGIFLSFVIHFTTALLAMRQHNQTPADPRVYLPLQGHHHVTSLAPALAHVTGYQPVMDNSGNRKLLGFHYYQPQAIQTIQGLTLVKVSDKLWVLTNGDIQNFHVGYVIYNGHYYQEPKTFFPTSWTPDQLTNYIVETVTNCFNRDTILEPFDIQAGKTPYSFSTYKFKLIGLAANDLNLIVVVKLIPAIASSMQIVTIYPEVYACGKPISLLTLEKIALQQKAATQRNQAGLTANHQQQTLQNTSNSNGSGSQKSPLELAAQSGDWQLISRLLEELEEDANFYEISNNREQALFCALSRNDFYSTLSLLNKKTINNPNKDGVTPLIYTLTRQAPSIEILELLLGYGSADANMSDRYRLTPLMHALRLAHQSNDMLQLAIAITQLLLEHKADPNTQDSNGNNALCYAIDYLQDKAEPFIKILLKAHADPTPTNNKGDSALSLAQKRNLPKIAALLQKHVYKKSTWLNKHKATELMYACYKGDIKKVAKLLANQALVNTPDAFGHTALYLSCIHNHLEVIELLLAAGAHTYHCINSNTIYELVQATKEIKQEIKDAVKKAYLHQMAPLLEKKQQQQKVAQEQKAAILQEFKHELATNHLSQETLTALQPYVNGIINTQGETPFLYAIKAQKNVVIEQLLHIQLSETNIENALIHAYSTQDKLLLELLIKSKKPTTPQLHSLWNKAQEQNNYLVLDLLATMLPAFRLGKIIDALRTGNKNLLEQLLISRPSLSNQDASLCLFKALELNESSLLEFIIKLYPQTLTSTNHLGQTPLIAAAFEDKPALFEILYNAQPNGDLKLALLKQLRASKIPKRIFERVKQLITIEEGLYHAHQLEQKSKVERGALEAQGYTSLMLSVYFEDNADSTNIQEINAQASNTDTTPLMLSTRHPKNNALLKLLSLPNIDIHAQDSNGKTALTHAIEHGNTEAIYHIIKGGAFLIPTQASQTALKTSQAHTLFNEAFIIKLMPILIFNNDTEAVKFLLYNGFKCFAKDKEGKTALHHAIDFNRTEIALLLLDTGLPLDVQGKNKLTPLEYANKIKAPTNLQHILHCYQTASAIHTDISLNDTNNRYLSRRALAFIYAATCGYDDVVTLLLSDGFNDDIALTTAFFTATDSNRISVLALLLKHAVDINFANTQGITTLMIAAEQGYIDCTKFLLKHGANPNIPNEIGTTALLIAAQKGYTEIVELLLNAPSVDPNVQDQHAETALIKACTLGYSSIVKLLLEKKANLNLQDKFGNTPLIMVLDKGFIPIARALLEAGAKPDIQNEIGSTALLIATEKGHTDIVKLLLNAPDVDPNVQDKHGETALIKACALAHTGIARALLEAGAKLDVQTKIGTTALLLAAVKGNTEIVELLLNVPDVDPNVQDQNGQAILIQACTLGYSGIVKLLLEKKANLNLQDKFGNTPLIMALDKGFIPIARALLEAGANPDIQNEIGSTALLIATEKGHTDIIKLLLNAPDVDPNVQDIHTETPLMKACALGHTSIVRALLEAGAKLDVQTKIGSTALLVAAVKGNTEIVELLLNVPDVDPNVQDQNGQAILIQACTLGYSGIVKLLL
ncbi:ankyrin repeat domain-containing protein, partial [Candidatus Dependentiae bacterium]|nr:ankyrin repeat domain-containing protein [Candidatus Dependentiae bacterium]